MSEISEVAKRYAQYLYDVGGNYMVYASRIQQAIDEALAGKDAEIAELKAEVKRLVARIDETPRCQKCGADRCAWHNSDRCEKCSDRFECREGTGYMPDVCGVCQARVNEEAEARDNADNADVGKGGDG